MNHCKKCGSQLVGDVRFCNNCGTPVEDDFAPKAQETTPVFHANSELVEAVGAEETTVLSQEVSPFGQPQSATQQNINIYVGQPQGQQNPFGQPQGQAQNQQSPFSQAQGQQSPFGQPQDQAQNQQSPFGQPQDQAQNQQSPFGQAQGQQSPFGQAQNQFSQYGQAQNQFGQPQGQAQNQFGQYGQAQNQFGQPQGQAQNQFGQPQGQYGQAQNQWGPLQQPAKKSSGGKVFAIVLLIIVLLGGAGFAGWYFLGDSLIKDSASSSASSDSSSSTEASSDAAPYDDVISKFKDGVNSNDAALMMEVFPMDDIPEEYAPLISAAFSEQFKKFTNFDIQVNSARKLSDEEIATAVAECPFNEYVSNGINVTEAYELDCTVSCDTEKPANSVFTVGKIGDKWYIINMT